jgi:hypothetical protein
MGNCVNEREIKGKKKNTKFVFLPRMLFLCADALAR